MSDEPFRVTPEALARMLKAIADFEAARARGEDGGTIVSDMTPEEFDAWLGLPVPEEKPQN